MKDKGWIITCAVLTGILLALTAAAVFSNMVSTGNMDFVDGQTYQMLKEIYGEIKFNGKFNEGNTLVYDYYKEKYAMLLNGEAKITEADGSEKSLESYGYDMRQLAVPSTNIYFFDMDEDNLPELCIAGDFGSYVFKYNKDTNLYRIWWKYIEPGGKILGSRKIIYEKDNAFYTFLELMQNGDVDYNVKFGNRGKGHSPDNLYLVSLPCYGEITKKFQLSNDIKRQGCVSKASGDFFYRLTKKQYETLMQPYFEADALLQIERVHISYFFPQEVYVHWNEFPDDMAFADRQAFELLADIYEEIDFSGEFKIGNIKVYDYYKEKYAELLSGKSKFSNKYGYGYKYGLEDYIDNLESLKDNSAAVYYFDMDEDEQPELCMEGVFGTFVFKYVPHMNQYLLWWKELQSGYQIAGSRKIRYNDESFHEFYQLKENGEEEFKVVFGIKKEENGSKPLYLVSLPLYWDETEVKIPENIRKQSYLSKADEYYFYRITKEQYEILTKEYFKTDDLTKETGLSDGGRYEKTIR